MVNDNILTIETGFEKLGEVLDHTEERLSSWSKDDRVWIIAGIIGFAIGISTGLMRWIMFGISRSKSTQGRNNWSSCGISPSNSSFRGVCTGCACFNDRIIRDTSSNTTLTSSSTDFHSTRYGFHQPNNRTRSQESRNPHESGIYQNRGKVFSIIPLNECLRLFCICRIHLLQISHIALLHSISTST